MQYITVTFEDPRDAKDAKALDKHNLYGHILNVGNVDGQNVQVYGDLTSLSLKSIEDCFSRYGTVLSVKQSHAIVGKECLPDPDEFTQYGPVAEVVHSRIGFWVIYEDPRDARDAKEAFKDKPWFITGRVIISYI